MQHTFSKFIDIAFFAFGLFSSKDVIPGWLGTGSRYASAEPAFAGGCPVCMNLRAAHRTCALLSTITPDTRDAAMIMAGMRDATRRECESQPPPHSRYRCPARPRDVAGQAPSSGACSFKSLLQIMVASSFTRSNSA